jgi:hypothetical protein
LDVLLPHLAVQHMHLFKHRPHIVQVVICLLPECGCLIKIFLLYGKGLLQLGLNFDGVVQALLVVVLVLAQGIQRAVLTRQCDSELGFVEYFPLRCKRLMLLLPVFKLIVQNGELLFQLQALLFPIALLAQSIQCCSLLNQFGRLDGFFCLQRIFLFRRQ